MSPPEALPLLRPPQRMPRLRYHSASRANRRRRRKMSARRSFYGNCVLRTSLWHERHSVGLRAFVKCLAMSLCDGISDAWRSCTLQRSSCSCSKQSWKTRWESMVLDCCYTPVLTHIADILRAYLGPKSEGEVQAVDDKVRQRLASTAPVNLSSTLRHLPEPRVGHLPQCPGPDGDPSSTATSQWPTTPHLGKLGTQSHGAALRSRHPHNISKSQRPPGLLLRLLLLIQAQLSSGAPTAPVKRAYNRAIRRASQSHLQGTIYRGRWHQLAAPRDVRPALPTASSSDSRARPRLVRQTLTRRGGHAHPRIRVATYNAGGLSTPAYHELLNWLSRMPDHLRPSILHIQETHWPADCEFCTPGWFAVATASPSAAAGGLLTLIADSLCTQAQISHAVPISGRVLHVRISLPQCTIDSVNVYQKIYISGASRQEKGQTCLSMEQRSQVWASIQALLRDTPQRHLLLLAGDFNTAPVQSASHVGSRAWLYPTPRVADAHRLQAILLDNQLVLLNSWTRSAVATHVCSTSSSLIDHIYVRRSQADSEARQAAPLVWPLGAWKNGGRHRPVGATIALPPFCTLQRRYPSSMYRPWLRLVGRSQWMSAYSAYGRPLRLGSAPIQTPTLKLSTTTSVSRPVACSLPNGRMVS